MSYLLFEDFVPRSSVAYTKCPITHSGNSFLLINLNCKGDRVLQSVLCQKSHCCLVVLIALMYCTSKTLFQQDHKMNFFFLNLTVCLSYSVNAETAPWLISRKPVQKPAAALSSFLQQHLLCKWCSLFCRVDICTETLPCGLH